jgi:hypothetical protein
VKRGPRLRLVSRGEGDATHIFDDLDKLRANRGAPLSLEPAQPGSPLRARRAREVVKFARLPYDRAYKLYEHIGGAPWMVLVELDRMILAQRGKNPVIFWSKPLRDIGLSGNARQHALLQLEAAGVIEIASRGRGLAPLVTHLWYPRQD